MLTMVCQFFVVHTLQILNMYKESIMRFYFLFVHQST
jgi:hypothetical protein